jgi:hypothetical protein
MSFQDLTTAAQHYFPNMQVKYKDQNWLMKILGKILFFTPDFMKSYTTTLGGDVYFPTSSFVKSRPVSSAVVLLHEIVHIHDEKRYTSLWFAFLYLFPQILSILCVPLFFLLSWKIVLPLMIITALPLPAVFRMHFEKRAYLSSLYVLHALSKRLNFQSPIDNQSTFFVAQFKESYYYFMWPFGNIQKDFDQALVKINAEQRPYEDPILFDMLDVLISKV